MTFDVKAAILSVHPVETNWLTMRGIVLLVSERVNGHACFVWGRSVIGAVRNNLNRVVFAWSLSLTGFPTQQDQRPSVLGKPKIMFAMCLADRMISA